MPKTTEELYRELLAKGDAAQQQANDLLSQYDSRGPFRYDASQDPLFQSYKNQYVHQGRRAMEDSMGQAAGLTGGYGSSYAQSVGNQAYNEYLTQLNAQIPVLAQQARAAYDAEGQRMLDRYNLALNAANTAYGQGRDALGDLRYEQETAYAKERDALADQRYQDEINWNRQQSTQNSARDYATYLLGMGIMPSAEQLAAAGMTPQEAASIQAYFRNQMAASGGGSGSNGSSSSSRRTADRTSNDDVTNPPAQTAMGPAQLSAYGAMAGVAGAASVPQNMITSAQRDELFAYGQKNGPQALAAYMDANYKGASNYWEIRRWLQSQLTKAQNSGAGGSGKPNVNMTR